MQSRALTGASTIGVLFSPPVGSRTGVRAHTDTASHTPSLSSTISSDSSSLYHFQNQCLHLLSFPVTGRRSQYWISAPERHTKDASPVTRCLPETTLHSGLWDSPSTRRPSNQDAPWLHTEGVCSPAAVIPICHERFWALSRTHPSHKQWFKQNENRKRVTHCNTPSPSRRKKAIKMICDD